jgi:hypothetical protein
MDHLQQHFSTLLVNNQQGRAHLQPQKEPAASVWQRHSNFQLFCMVISIFFWVFSFTAAFTAITIR